MNPQVVRLFEGLADATWDRINFGQQLKCSQGEETITDINLLEFKRARLRNVRVIKFNKAQESDTGLDWEWWIGSYRRGWWRYAVQAKKLDSSYTPKAGTLERVERYSSIRHKVDHQFQIDLLEKYALANKCIPLYCFYNYTTESDLHRYWHCSDTYDKNQLGCTVAPINIVRNAFYTRGAKTFQFIHSYKSALPWRCLVKCPHVLVTTSNEPHPLATGIYATYRAHSVLPPFAQLEPSLEGFDQYTPLDFFLPDFYSHNVRIGESILYPKQILVIDVE